MDGVGQRWDVDSRPMGKAKAKHEEKRQPLRLEDVDLDAKEVDLDDDAKYEKELEKLQRKLALLQIARHHDGKKAIIVIEGWDAAGKGGAIKRLTEKLDPRGVNVYPIGAPNEEERGKHYLWRFIRLLPEPGDIAIYDRSWYGRVCVERVEGYCKKPEWKRAYQEINEFERWMVDDGCPVIKLFVHISKKEQLERFEDRAKDALKKWKLGPDDWRNRKKWDEYVEAYDDMFEKTSTDYAPWTIVEGDDKQFARLKVLRTVVAALSGE